jgi:hypothetical protein
VVKIGGTYSLWDDEGSAFEDSEDSEVQTGWPRFSEIKPLLIRSAGIVGIAGTIMAVVSSSAWMAEPRRAQESAAPAEAAGAKSIEMASAAPSDEGAALVAVAEPSVEPISLRPEPVVSAPEVIDPGQVQPMFPPPPEEPDTTAALPAARSADLIPAIVRPDAAGAPIIAPSPETPPPAAEAEVTPPVAQSEATPPAAQPEVIPLAAEPQAVALASPQPADVVPAEGSSESSSVEMAPVPECPRDWISDNAATSPGSAAGCQTLAALLTDAAPDDQAALDRAASEHAEELAALFPRLPRARPEPPARPIRRTGAVDLSWPDEPPPNCGSKRARWRFTDAERTQKEWFCR